MKMAEKHNAAWSCSGADREQMALPNGRYGAAQFVFPSSHTEE